MTFVLTDLRRFAQLKVKKSDGLLYLINKLQFDYHLQANFQLLFGLTKKTNLIQHKLEDIFVSQGKVQLDHSDVSMFFNS